MHKAGMKLIFDSENSIKYIENQVTKSEVVDFHCKNSVLNIGYLNMSLKLKVSRWKNCGRSRVPTFENKEIL